MYMPSITIIKVMSIVVKTEVQSHNTQVHKKRNVAYPKSNKSFVS